MSKSVRPLGRVEGRSNVTLLAATGESADAVRWVLKAASKDTTRAVMCGTLCVRTVETLQWFVATDGRRMHATTAESLCVADGTYHIILNTTTKVIGILDADLNYPNYIQVVPTSLGAQARVSLPYRRSNGSDAGYAKFRYVTGIMRLSKRLFDMAYLDEAMDGFWGTDLTIGHADDNSPFILCDTEDFALRKRYAVIMPTRAEP